MIYKISRKTYQFKKLFIKTQSVFLEVRGISYERYCMTPESDPGKHTVNELGMFYSINNSLSLDILFKRPVFQPYIIEECKTFGETPLLIRKPALEIINCLKHTDFKKPVNKYVLYGKYGMGKSTTIHHLIHYAHVSNWLIVHVPSILAWSAGKKEICESTTMDGFLDVPTFGSNWLSQFKTQNFSILQEPNLILQKDYKWNIKEKNDAGEPLINLVNHGITRARYSCDVINALLEEIKLLSKSGVIKTLVAINGYSHLFHPAKMPKNRKIKNYDPAKISALKGFKNMAKSDWHNGAVILSCGATPKSNSKDEHLPLNQLTLEGFEFLTPFVPIEIPLLTKQEIKCFLNYYRSKKWLLSSEGDEELAFLCGGNPHTLKKLCGPL